MDSPVGQPGQARPEHPLDEILAGIAEGFIAFDGDWRISYINAAAEQMSGRSGAALLGRPVLDALNIDRHNPFHIAYTASKAEGEPVAFSAFSDLVGRWVEVRGYPYPGGFAILFRDVSEERRAHHDAVALRRELGAATSVNRRIFETSLDLILVVDSRGNFVRVSPSALAIVGYRPEDMIGRNAIDFLFPDDLENTRSEMRTARRTGIMRNFECRYVHKDGHVVPLSWSGVWSEPERQHFFIGRDMTERLAAEERQHRSQRLEAVGQLTGGIAHDFNNLLSVVIGNLDLLEGCLKDDAQAQPLAAKALQAALRGAELTRRLLAFARRQPLDAKVVTLNERISATLDLLRRTLGEQIEIATLLAPELWPTLVDPAQFESALVNLAINARDAMRANGGGGRLVIETSNRPLDEDYARENVDAAPGDYVMVAVSDTGMGMAPEVLARVFEPFFTTKAPGEGTGLGLSMVYGFIRQSQGHIKIYSEPGVGTTVRLYLPRAHGPAEVVEAAEAVALPKGGAERILVVEDNADVRRMVVTQLGGLGYRTVEADNAEAALAILRQGEPVDLLFTDIVMPGRLDGTDLARAALALRPGLKLLLTSGFAKAALESGPQSPELKNLLSKPYRKSELAAKLREVIDGEG
jgi:PAS domain S-box-containing protein